MLIHSPSSSLSLTRLLTPIKPYLAQLTFLIRIHLKQDTNYFFLFSSLLFSFLLSAPLRFSTRLFLHLFIFRSLVYILLSFEGNKKEGHFPLENDYGIPVNKSDHSSSFLSLIYLLVIILFRWTDLASLDRLFPHGLYL